MRLHRCAGWSVPLLFAYGINRFSHDMAHLRCNFLRLISWTLKGIKLEIEKNECHISEGNHYLRHWPLWHKSLLYNGAFRNRRVHVIYLLFACIVLAQAFTGVTTRNRRQKEVHTKLRNRSRASCGKTECCFAIFIPGISHFFLAWIDYS